MGQQPPSGSGGSRVPANLDSATAGASLGTVIALLANNLPDTYWFKSWLIILAPIIAVGVSTLAAWGKRWYTRKSHKQELEDSLDFAEEYLSSIIRRRSSTPSEREYAKEKLALLKKQRIDRVVDRAVFFIAREREEEE